MTTATITEGFQIGDGATYAGWSDSKAGTIIAKTAKTITWQEDKWTLLNGIHSGAEDALEFSPGGFCGHTSGIQRYAYEQNPTGAIVKFTLRKNGKWIRQGQGLRGGSELRPGRSRFYDFNF